MSFDEGSFSFKFDCSLCPSDVLNLILSAFKGPLLNEIKSQARDVVNKEVVATVNKLIMEGYPLSIPLNDKLSLATTTTGPVSVKTNYLSGPIDGTVFLTVDGYNRPFDSPELPITDECDPGDICLFISKYAFQTTEKALNEIPLQFTSTVLGFDVMIDINGTQVPLGIDTREKDLFLSGGITATIPGLAMKIEIGGEALIDFFFQPGDATNMIYIDPVPNREALKLTTFKISVFGVQVNLGIFAWVVNFFTGYIIDWFVIPVIAIPKIDALPLTATAATIDFFERYTQAGLAFNFGVNV
jgi:hypothetical protein